MLQIEGIVKRFGTYTALDGITMEVPPGKVFGLLGPNGAGKTTLIRIITRITGPDEGRVLLNGREMGPEDVARMGYLPEERGLYKKMKVGEQTFVIFGAEIINVCFKATAEIRTSSLNEQKWKKTDI